MILTISDQEIDKIVNSIIPKINTCSGTVKLALFLMRLDRSIFSYDFIFCNNDYRLIKSRLAWGIKHYRSYRDCIDDVESGINELIDIRSVTEEELDQLLKSL